MRGIMHLAQEGRDAAARAAMQDEGGLSLGVSAFLEINLVEARDPEAAAVEGLDLGVKAAPFHHLPVLGPVHPAFATDLAIR